MSTTALRSKTGCMTCKNRRKKCDETRPVCERCTKAGMHCLGYSYLENPSKQKSIIKSKAALRLAAATSNVDHLSHVGSSRLDPSTAATANLGTPSQSLIPGQNAMDSFTPHLIQDHAHHPTTEGDFYGFFTGISANEPLLGDTVYKFPLLPPSQHRSPSSLPLGRGAGLGFGEDPGMSCSSNSVSSTPSDPSNLRGLSSTLDRQLGVHFPRVPHPNSSLQPPLTSGQASLYHALLDLGQPPLGSTCLVQPPSDQDDGVTRGACGSDLLVNAERDDEAMSEDSDPEDIKEIVCGTLPLDSTVQSNSLPFVLQSYANWTAYMIFEPLRFASRLKSRITSRFLRSEDSRISVTMFAGLLHAMWKKRVVVADYMMIASLLRQRVRGRVIQASSRLQIAAETDEDVNRALYESIEMVSILRMTARSWSNFMLLKETAALFRSACPEPVNELVDLPKRFLHPDVHLREFIVMDVLISLCHCQPMLFRYKVDYDPDISYAIFATDTKGFQWSSGVPDHIVFLIARMNMLRADHGSNVNPVIIASLVEELHGFKPRPSVSTDAYLTIARLAVQECWRLAVFVYLYMGLDGANSTDPRVEKVYKNFMRLLERTKPGRIPDAFLITPILLVGVASGNERERALIRKRLLGLQECAHPGTCGHDVVQVLGDIWARSGIERRPAVWDDLRIGYAKILRYG